MIRPLCCSDLYHHRRRHRHRVSMTGLCDIWPLQDWVVNRIPSCKPKGETRGLRVVWSPPFHLVGIGGSIRSTGFQPVLGSLSSNVFERRTSTGSEPFPLLISLDATIFVLPSVLILIETICPKICSKSRLKSAKRPLPVDVRRSKTSLLKLPIALGVTETLETPYQDKMLNSST